MIPIDTSVYMCIFSNVDHCYYWILNKSSRRIIVLDDNTSFLIRQALLCCFCRLEVRTETTHWKICEIFPSNCFISFCKFPYSAILFFSSQELRSNIPYIGGGHQYSIVPLFEIKIYRFLSSQNNFPLNLSLDLGVLRKYWLINSYLGDQRTAKKSKYFLEMVFHI